LDSKNKGAGISNQTLKTKGKKFQEAGSRKEQVLQRKAKEMPTLT
jgi:hypothetical protein